MQVALCIKLKLVPAVRYQARRLRHGSSPEHLPRAQKCKLQRDDALGQEEGSFPFPKKRGTPAAAVGQSYRQRRDSPGQEGILLEILEVGLLCRAQEQLLVLRDIG